MTRKEQINGLYELKQYLVDNPIELNGHTSLPITLIDYAIEALEQEPRWIPVSERLPEIQNYSGNYLVTLKSGEVHIGMFIERNGKHWWTHYDDVVAWMPLPQPYKE